MDALCDRLRGCRLTLACERKDLSSNNAYRHVYTCPRVPSRRALPSGHTEPRLEPASADSCEHGLVRAVLLFVSGGLSGGTVKDEVREVQGADRVDTDLPACTATA